MLLFGKMLDPQPASDVAVAPGVEPIYEHGHSHDAVHEHDHEDHGHGNDHGHGHHDSPLKFLVKLICPGMVLLSFLFSAGAVWQLASHTAEERSHQIIQFT